MVQDVLPFVHSILEKAVSKEDIVIDATLGNGHDTLFLSKLSKHVHGFDIQKQAITKTTELLKQEKVDNVSLYQLGHENIGDIIQDKVKAITYNLGYLPGSDKSVRTLPDTTIESIKAGTDMLVKQGIITIIVYIGHKGGVAESNSILSFIQELDRKQFRVLKYQFINRLNPPYVLIIEKVK